MPHTDNGSFQLVFLNNVNFDNNEYIRKGLVKNTIQYKIPRRQIKNPENIESLKHYKSGHILVIN